VKGTVQESRLKMCEKSSSTQEGFHFMQQVCLLKEGLEINSKEEDTER
jgi:hypothetical protein